MQQHIKTQPISKLQTVKMHIAKKKKMYSNVTIRVVDTDKYIQSKQLSYNDYTIIKLNVFVE